MDPAIPEIEHLKLRIDILEEEKKNLEDILQKQTIELKYALFDAEAANREKTYFEKMYNDKK